MDFNLGFGQVKMVKTYDLLKNLKILIIISDLTYIRLFHVNYMHYVTLFKQLEIGNCGFVKRNSK